MKIYKIKVNGKVYEVEVEVSEKSGSIVKENNINNTPSLVSNSSNSRGEEVKAPMQGNILSIKVKKGDNVSKGDVLLILEAMKMENEILSPISGIVEDVLVSSGNTVNNGDVLIVIR